MPRILPVYTYDNEILRKKCEENIDIALIKEYIEIGDLEFNKKYAQNPEAITKYHEQYSFVNNMEQTLLSLPAVGISANQLGALYNVFMIKFQGNVHAYINPELLEVSEEKETKLEGCLSFPSVELEIERPKAIKLKYITENLDEDVFDSIEILKTEDTPENFQEKYLYNALTRILLHEYDHLQGKLFIDYMNDEQKQNADIQQKLSRINKGYGNSKYMTIR